MSNWLSIRCPSPAVGAVVGGRALLLFSFGSSKRFLREGRLLQEPFNFWVHELVVWAVKCWSPELRWGSFPAGYPCTSWGRWGGSPTPSACKSWWRTPGSRWTGCFLLLFFLFEGHCSKIVVSGTTGYADSSSVWRLFAFFVPVSARVFGFLLVVTPGLFSFWADENPVCSLETCCIVTNFLDTKVVFFLRLVCDLQFDHQAHEDDGVAVSLQNALLAEVVERWRDVLQDPRWMCNRGIWRWCLLRCLIRFFPLAWQFPEVFHIELSPRHKAEPEKAYAVACWIFAKIESARFTIAHMPIWSDEKRTSSSKRNPSAVSNHQASGKGVLWKNTSPHACFFVFSCTAHEFHFISTAHFIGWLKFVRRKVIGHSCSTVPLKSQWVRYSHCATARTHLYLAHLRLGHKGYYTLHFDWQDVQHCGANCTRG